MKFNQLLVATFLSVGASLAAMAQGTSAAEEPLPVSTVTRAEVLADLQIYRESGLADLDRGEGSDPSSEAYVRAEAKYARLRASPYYATLVRQIAMHRGETMTSPKG